MCQGHRVKVKVTGAKIGYTRVTKYEHSRVVRLRLKGKLVLSEKLANGISKRNSHNRSQRNYAQSL